MDAAAVLGRLSPDGYAYLAGFFQTCYDESLATALADYAEERAAAGSPISVEDLAAEIFDRGYTFIDGVPHLAGPSTSRHARNPERKVIAVSKDRYRASAEERRRYGGNTVTEFYVMYKDDERDASKWKKIFGYGKTPGERKTYAIEKFRAMQAQGNPSRLIPPPGFGQWAKGLFGNGKGVEIHVVRRGAGKYAAKARKDGKWIAEGHGATQQEALDAVAGKIRATNPAPQPRLSKIQILAQRLVNGG
jgi:hypothetical protein